MTTKPAPRAFITGMEGFTGQYLATELAQAGYAVYGTTYGETSASTLSPIYNRFAVDLRDGEALKTLVAEIKPDIVAHLAAISFVAHHHTEAIYTTNQLGTLHLLEALAAMPKPPKSLLLASSAQIYGNSTQGTLHEGMIANPMNDYAVSKYAMEHMARLWLDRLPLFIVRPFNYTGIGQRDVFLIPKIVRHFRAKKTAIALGHVNISREFGDVRTVVKIYRTLLEKPPVGETLNVCTGQAYPLREVMQCCETLTGHTMQINTDPTFIRHNEVRLLKGDPTRLKAHLDDWVIPDLEHTLRWMLSES